MAIDDFDDEFSYLSENGDETDEFAPQIKGSREQTSSPESSESKQEVEEEKEVEEKAEKKEVEQKFNSQIFVVKVTTNKEDKALEMISTKVQKKGVDIYSIARPHGLRGYIFLESPDREHAEDAVFNLPYVKGIIGKTLTYAEVKPMLEPVTADVKIEKGDIVEIISEPFKNEKAKVLRVDKTKGECVVSLLGAAVPIPVTVKIDNLRVIRREEMEE